MCGIAGIINSEPLQSAGNEYLSSLRDRLHKMTTSLEHRGPDGEGVWIDSNGRAGLGNRRLSIIDLSDAGNQPMHYLNRYTIVHNGEIYNYIELRSALEKEGYSFHSQTNTVVIAAAYACWKDECV